MEIERIIFVETDGVNAEIAERAFSLLNNDNAYAAIDYLSEWHYPGEHDTTNSPDNGSTCFDISIEKDRYILFYNHALGHIGLNFISEVEDSSFSRKVDSDGCGLPGDFDYSADYLARSETSLW